MRRTIRLPPRHDFAGTLQALRPLHTDPSARLSGDELWWACRTPDGPGTLRLTSAGEATGYGPGAAWLIEQADAIAGLRDDVSGFDAVAAAHPVVRRAWRERHGLRMTRTGRLFQHLVPTILGQKVTGKEAARSYTKVVRHFGEPAPGPVKGLPFEGLTASSPQGWGLLLPPEPAAVAATPYWVFHPYGVEAKRADTLRRAAAVADSLERSPDAATATARLCAIPGIGVWSAAEVVRLAYGDPDALSLGDYHIPHHVVHALTGAPRAGSREPAPGRQRAPEGYAQTRLSEADLRMLEVLEPFRGQRARVCQLLMASTPAPPRYGPRLPIRSFARY